MRSIVLAVLLIAAPSLQAQTGGWEALERTTADVMRATRTPGVQVVVVRGDRAVYARGFGVADVETREPMTPDLLAQVGSLTKPFTAALVLTLASDHVVDLGAPIGRAVTGLRPGIARLTTSQLLSQTAGLRDREGSYGPSDEALLLRAAREIGDTISLLPPGLSFSYSNIGFALAGLTAQEAARRPFADLIRDRLLRPLGMTSSTMRPAEAARFHRATGHALTPAGDSVVVVRPTADDTRIWPAGYLYTSATEAARFVIALMNGGRLTGRQAIPPSVPDAMFTTHVRLPGMPNATRYGYGMFLDTLRGLESAWHPGSMPGFSTLVRMIPSRRVGVVVIANRSDVRLDRIAEAALEDALRSLGVPFPAAVPAQSSPPDPDRTVGLADYVGTYANRFAFELAMKDGALVLRRFGTELPVVPLGGDLFAVRPVGTSTIERFQVVPAAGDRPAYAQMFLWTFPRTRTSP